MYPWPVDPKGPDDSDLRAANADQADVASKDMLSLFRSWPAERGQLRNFIVTERGQGLLGDATAILGFSKGRPAAAATIPVGKITALPTGGGHWGTSGYRTTGGNGEGVEPLGLVRGRGLPQGLGGECTLGWENVGDERSTAHAPPRTFPNPHSGTFRDTPELHRERDRGRERP